MAKDKPTPAQTHEPLLWPVVGRDLDTLNAIADGLALVHSILGNDAAPWIALHILAGESAQTRDLVSPVSLLAEILVEGAANEELISILAKTFKVSKSSVKIVSGARGRGKQVSVEGELETLIEVLTSNTKAEHGRQ